MLLSILRGVLKWVFIIGMGVLGLLLTLWLIALLVWPGNLWGEPIWFAARDFFQGIFTAQPVFDQRSDTPAVEPTPKPEAESTREAPASPPSQECKAIDEYEVQAGGTALSSGDDSWIHAQLWAPGHAEVESILDSGTYDKRQDVAGYVWLYPSSCTMEQLLEEVNGSIYRRKMNGANTDGYVDPSWYFDQGWLSR